MGSTRTLLFRHGQARVVGRPFRLASHLVSHRTPEPGFKGLLGLTVYLVRVISHLTPGRIKTHPTASSQLLDDQSSKCSSDGC